MRALLRQEIVNQGMPRLPFGEELLELLPQGDWCDPKEAAAALGYESVDSFRAAWCDPKAPRLRIWQRPGPGGGRRILVDRQSLRGVIAAGVAG